MKPLCDCFDEIDPAFLEEVDTNTGISEWHPLYTVCLGELVETGVFDWSRPELDWSETAYDEAQYARVCAYFIERFRYDEISTLPVKQWMNSLHRRLAYELMPKYRDLYKRTEGGINPFQEKDEYHKRRQIRSDYPETLLSANADYISDGTDLEYETVTEGQIADMAMAYANNFRAIDAMLLDELEVMFVQVYTANVNGL